MKKKMFSQSICSKTFFSRFSKGQYYKRLYMLNFMDFNYKAFTCGSTQVGSKYKSKMEVTNGDKH